MTPAQVSKSTPNWVGGRTAAIDVTPTELLALAHRACDHWGDSPAARDDMRRQIAEVPPHLRAELLAHLNRTYPVKETDPWAP